MPASLLALAGVGGGRGLIGSFSGRWADYELRGIADSGPDDCFHVVRFGLVFFSGISLHWLD